MRVLFYVEPHPIRDSQTHFHDIAKRFLKLLEQLAIVDARMFANAKTLASLPAECLKGVEKRIIPATPDEEELFASYMLDWNVEGIQLWLELMEGGGVANDYLGILRRIYQVFPFDVIVHWGENGAITKFLSERPVTRIAMELGCTRPPFLDSLVMDLFGTNGSALVPKLTVSDLRAAVDGQSMSRQEAMFAFSETIEAKSYESCFAPMNSSVACELLKADRSVFLPLQLFDDANLLRFSNFKTITDVVLNVVPKLAQKGYTTIIKPHPASKHRPSAVLANTMARDALKDWSDKIIWCDRPDLVYHNTQLIQLADFTVTVNSSVGFEALYFDKPVVVLGDAVYKPEGLFPMLDEILEGGFDRDTYLKNIGYLRQFFFGAYLQSNALVNNSSEFFHLLVTLVQLSNTHASNATEIAAAFYRGVNPIKQTLARGSMFAGHSVPGVNEFGPPKLIAEKAVSKSSLAHPVNQDYARFARNLARYSGIKNADALRDWLAGKSTTEAGLLEIVEHGEIVDREYYLKINKDVEDAQMDPAVHYASSGIFETRAPRDSIRPRSQQEMLSNLSEAANTIFWGLHYPLSDEEKSKRNAELAAISRALGKRNSRICVVAHLYYRDLVPEILTSLRTIDQKFDLIVTMPDWGTRQIMDMVLTDHPNALFYHSVNRGRDIGPFVDLLPILLKKNYTALLKLQTKRGYFRAGKLLPTFGKFWREQTFSALLGSTEKVRVILDAFQNDTGLNLVGPQPYLLSLKDYPYHDRGDFAEAILPDRLDPAEGSFFAGTMFWVRPACLAPLILEGKIDITSFMPEIGENDGAFAHLIERIFGQLAMVGDGRIATIGVNSGDILLQQPVPLEMSVDEYLRKAIEEARVARSSKHVGALAW